MQSEEDFKRFYKGHTGYMSAVDVYAGLAGTAEKKLTTMRRDKTGKEEFLDPKTMTGKGEKCSGHADYCSDENCSEISEECRTCGKRDVNLKRCSKCRHIQYCSKECQRKDWKRHKKVCKAADDNNNEEVPSPGISSMSFEDAKSTAGKLFPGKKLIDSLSRVSTMPTQGVFVGLIAAMHFYAIRHGIYVQDKMGKQTILFFYVDYDKPEPYFKWSDIIPGKYICIENPSLHVFMDGQVGFRIDEASDIHIIG